MQEAHDYETISSHRRDIYYFVVSGDGDGLENFQRQATWQERLTVPVTDAWERHLIPDLDCYLTSRAGPCRLLLGPVYVLSAAVSNAVSGKL